MNEEQILVTDEEVNSFLTKYYTDHAEALTYIQGGKHSEAFSYMHEGGNYIVRFNKSNRGFLKDVYAYKHFVSNGIPIPKSIDTGTYKDGIYFSLSEKVFGETPKDAYKRGDFSSLVLQCDMIENIKNVPVPREYDGYGEIELGQSLHFKTLEEYLMSIYTSNNIFDWEELKKLPYFDQHFVDYLVIKVKELVRFGEGNRALLHGDFGNDNLFIQEGRVSGVIDWERLRVADHFLDVGRVVIFCPRRDETVHAVLSYYKDKGYEQYKERISLGVYFAMLRNYGAAAKSGNEASCASAPERIEEFEKLMREN